MILLLHILVNRKWTELAIKILQKSTHDDHYLNFQSNHPTRVNRVMIQSLHSRDSIICQEAPHLLNEVVTCDVTFGLELIPNGSLSQILIPSVAVFQREKKGPRRSVLVFCVTRIYEYRERSDVLRTVTTLGLSSQQTTLVVHSSEPDRKETRSRRHSV